MNETVNLPFGSWESFYVIVGSSGAALTGLQFVVIALGAESRLHTTDREIQTFATPNIVHFSAVLLVSALFSAPWHGLSLVSVLLGTFAGFGFVYCFIVTRRAMRQPRYKPVLEDWIFHVALPTVAYGVLLVAAFTLVRHTTTSLFVIGATVLLLLFIGIHNAWDTVTYIATVGMDKPEAHLDKDSGDRKDEEPA